MFYPMCICAILLIFSMIDSSLEKLVNFTDSTEILLEIELAKYVSILGILTFQNFQSF